MWYHEGVLTVAEAARITGKNPETIRRWIRSGRLAARKFGTQHVIDEDELEDMLDPGASLPVPPELQRFPDGRPMPDPVPLIRELRDAAD